MLLSSRKWLRVACGLLETTNLLALKLWFRHRAHSRLFPGIVYRNYMSLVRDERWASRSIWEVLDGLAEPGRRITLQALPGEGICTPIDELAYMALLTQAVQPKLVFEIGTFRGRTALNFALNSPEDCRVLTLDLPTEGRADVAGSMKTADARIIAMSLTGVDYRGTDVASKIEQLYGDSTKFDFAPYEGQADIVFVDGGHTYDVARRDSETAFRIVRPGGFILWHDFANYGDYNDVTRAVLDVAPTGSVVQIENTQLAVVRKSGGR